MSPRSIRRAHARRIARDARRAQLRRRRQLATAGVIGAAALMAPQAQAASFQVINTNDSGAGSLRNAIGQANAAGTDDEITFAPGVNGLIRLTTGEIVISANQGLTITGPGRDVLAVSGDKDASNSPNAGDSRVFRLNIPSGSAGIGVTISGLTLTRGFEPGGGGGGAIFNQTASPMTINDTAITNSQSNDRGGGIWSEGDLTIARSTISGNVSPLGGGLYERASGSGSASATITDSTISDNHATGPGARGGGIFAGGKYLTIERSTVSGNTSVGVGGGLVSYSKYGTTIRNSAFSGNSAEGGGGMAISAGSGKYTAARITETTISGNQGTHGAGAEIIRVGGGSKVTFARSTISGNDGGANSWGGGLLVDYGVQGSVNLLDSTVSGNTATAGGGVSLGSDRNSQLIETSEDGTPGSIDFDNSTIAGNAATDHGGGIYLSQYDSGSPSVKKSGSANITSTIVADNTAAGAAQDLDRVDTSTDGGFNGAFSLVEAPGDAPLTQQSMLVGIDPQLGSLGDHGGPTATMLPAGTSPVIDQGRSDEKLKVDQRNLDRLVDTGIANPSPGGDGTDIGSVELPADQVVVPPPPKATFAVTVRGKSISPGTPLVPASLLPLDCAVTVTSMTSCSIELRSNKATKISKKVTIAKGSLLAEGVATSANGVTQLSVKVKLTRDGKDVLKAQPVGVDTIVDAGAATDSSNALTAKGVVHLLSGPSVTLGLGKRATKLPKTVNKRIDELAKLIPDAKTVTCTAFSDKGKGDVTLTKKQATAACKRLVKDGVKGKVTSTGKGHAKPVASNKTKKGRALNRRLVIKFTL
jgi:hypothetical protein